MDIGLVGWIAKDARAEIDGKSLLLHAAAVACAAPMSPMRCRQPP
jgi:hypothetical protein